MQQKREIRKLSVVMPCFNERNTIEEIVRRVFDSPVELPIELIIVDDGSTDGTREILPQLAERYGSQRLKLLLHERNRGKGAALRTGFQHVTGDVVVIQDADLEYDPQDYPRLLGPILAGQADVVYGTRFGAGVHRVLLFWHYVGNRIVTLLSNMMTNLNLTDMETCYKAFRAEVVRRIRIRSNRFGVEPELTAKVAKLGCRIYEVPINYYGRDYTEGKKITWRDGLAALWHILRFRFFD